MWAWLYAKLWQNQFKLSTDELREQLQKPWKAPNFKSSLFLILKGTCFYYICYMFIVGSRRESVYFKNYDIQSKYKNYSFLSCWTWHKTCKVRNATNLLGNLLKWNITWPCYFSTIDLIKNLDSNAKNNLMYMN